MPEYANRTEHHGHQARGGGGGGGKTEVKTTLQFRVPLRQSTTIQPTQWYHPLVIHVSGQAQGQGRINPRQGEGARVRFIPASSPLSVAGNPGKDLWWELKEGTNCTSVQSWGSMWEGGGLQQNASLVCLCLVVCGPPFVPGGTYRASSRSPSPLHSHFCTYRVL